MFSLKIFRLYGSCTDGNMSLVKCCLLASCRALFSLHLPFVCLTIFTQLRMLSGLWNETTGS